CGNASTKNGAARCAGAAAASTGSCVSAVGVELRSCYLTTGAGCTADDSQIAAALGAVETAVTADCRDSAAGSAAGVGPLLPRAPLAERRQPAGRSEAASLAARSFGGPQAAALAGADAPARACLERAHVAGSNLIDQALAARARCIDARDGATGAADCDT